MNTSKKIVEDAIKSINKGVKQSKKHRKIN